MVTEYINCETVMAFFTTSEEVDTLGPYNEMFSLIQVEFNGSLSYYIPYIYVTNDVALTAGREVVRAPKKLVHIGIIKENNIVLGYLERPKGKRLPSVTVKPEQRVSEEFLDPLMPRRLELYSLRVLPPIEGGDGIAQLVDILHGQDLGRRCNCLLRFSLCLSPHTQDYSEKCTSWSILAVRHGFKTRKGVKEWKL